MAAPQSPSTLSAQLPRVKQTPETPHRRGITQKPTIAVTLEPAPNQRLNINTKIEMTLGHKKRKPPHREPHIIPDKTEVITPIPQPYDGSTCNVPLVHIYNTRSRCLKGQNIMANHVEKFFRPENFQPHHQPTRQCT